MSEHTLQAIIAVVVLICVVALISGLTIFTVRSNAEQEQTKRAHVTACRSIPDPGLRSNCIVASK